MMKFTTDNGNPVCTTELKDRFGVYLDNDSLIELAKGDPARRDRLLKALRCGGDLLFSWTNAVEVTGPEGASARAVRDFLDRVGPCWVPLHMNAWTVVERERAALTYQAPVSTEFVEAYIKERIHNLYQANPVVLDLSAEAFFRLGAVLDWGQQNKGQIRKCADILDQKLQELLKQERAEDEKDPTFLDRMWPPVPFDDHRPATFVMIHLLRMLVVEAKAFQFKDHDARDFCHAVVAAAYGSVATLDKQWKRRVENLQKPNRLAKLYYRPEVDQLVDMLEELIAVSNDGSSGLSG